MLKSETGKLQTTRDLRASAFLTAGPVGLALDIFVLESTLLSSNLPCHLPTPRETKFAFR